MIKRCYSDIGIPRFGHPYSSNPTDMGIPSSYYPGDLG